MNLLLTTINILLLKLIIGNNDWGYDKDNGPSRWGSISSAYKICKEGKRQSPIALKKHVSDFTTNKDYVNEWPNTEATLAYVSSGNAISVDLASVHVPFFELDGYELYLKQFHIHTPAEHTIDGKRADLEAHFVFTNDYANAYQVFGVLFDVDLFLEDHDGFFKGLSQSSKITNKKEFCGLELGSLYKAVHGFQSGHVYRGSLTTPPCTEAARFIISDHILSISSHQLDILKSAVHGNNSRPIRNTTELHEVGVFECTLK
ncbi:carbonic anhydrase [Neoconidiobolus thromboides FSU 785]|nr:carbonic anhydrase [Neoconidiobolus thromboides FSU 785]